MIFTSEWIDRHNQTPVKWGPLGLVTFLIYYSRVKPNGKKETWAECCARVCNGVYDIQKWHCQINDRPFNHTKAIDNAHKMFIMIFTFKFLPPGRGLWAMGTEAMWKHGAGVLNNCGFFSTQDLTKKPFSYLMQFSMLGVGCGLDTRGAGSRVVQRPARQEIRHVVQDSREGWVESTDLLLDSFLYGGPTPSFDYRGIRKRGELLKTFGGTASGPDPLIDLHRMLTDLWTEHIGRVVSSSLLTDTANMIGVCVEMGNIRRSAEIILGGYGDQDFYRMKDDQEKVKLYRYMSNNTVLCPIGADYTGLAAHTALNGEPGYAWLENMKWYGRMNGIKDPSDWNAMGCNPCVEQTLWDRELCVSGSTKIQTREGVVSIEGTPGKECEIWNGEAWSAVYPFYTGEHELYRVTLTDGSYLDVTAKHRWSVKFNDEASYKMKSTDQLKVGMKVPEYTLSECGGVSMEKNEAYTLGWVCGDGFIDRNRVLVTVNQPEYSIIPDLYEATEYREQHPEGYANPFKRVRCKVPLDLGKHLRNHDVGMPDEILCLDPRNTAEFIAGWVDTDGSVAASGIRIYGSEQKIRDGQLLLRRIGINHSSVNTCKSFETGSITNKGMRNYTIWYLQIPGYEAHLVPCRLRAPKISGRYKTNNAHPEGKVIDAARKQRIRSIQPIGKGKTYCFYEKNTGMGVFGNVLTHQCNLVETFPGLHANLHQYMRTLKMAYLYAKTVTLMKTGFAEVDAVIEQNRRIGCSQSGVIKSFNIHGRTTILDWCDKSYDFLTGLDADYSCWLGVNRSIKRTSIKPSGTVPLLPGETGALNYPISEFYYRTIRIDKASPILLSLERAGYRIEPNSYGGGGNTMVVYFPVREENFTKGEADVSMWEQLENAAQYQRYWADNQVSTTIKFDQKEAKDIPVALEMYQHRLKAVCFLPKTTEFYPQAPYQAIDKTEYSRHREHLEGAGPVDFSDLGVEGLGASGCDGDKCTL